MNEPRFKQLRDVEPHEQYRFKATGKWYDPPAAHSDRWVEVRDNPEFGVFCAAQGMVYNRNTRSSEGAIIRCCSPSPTVRDDWAVEIARWANLNVKHGGLVDYVASLEEEVRLLKEEVAIADRPPRASLLPKRSRPMPGSPS